MPIRHKLRGIPATPMRFQALYGPPAAFLFGWWGYIGVLAWVDYAKQIALYHCAGCSRSAQDRPSAQSEPEAPLPFSSPLRGSTDSVSHKIQAQNIPNRPAGVPF